MGFSVRCGAIGAAFSLCLTATAGTIAYTYDALGRLILADYGSGKTISYGYNDAGSLTQKVVAGSTGEFAISNVTPLAQQVVLAVQAEAGRSYCILASNDLANIGVQLLQTNPPGDFTFVDPIPLSPGERRFYQVVDKTAGDTNPAVSAGYSFPMNTGEWIKLSMPIEFGEQDGLHESLGEQLKRGLSGHDAQGDLLFVLDTNCTWETYILNSATQWADMGSPGIPSSNPVSKALSFWIRSRFGPADTNALYTGLVITNAQTFTFASNKWHMFAWPFSAPRLESDGVGPEQGWGFQAAGGSGGANHLLADQIFIGSSNQFRLLYMGTDGRWRNLDGTAASTDRLEAGEGYYYFNSGTTFNWTPVDVN